MRLILKEILRILTPEELNDLSTVSEGELLFSLTEMMEKEVVIPRLQVKSSRSSEISDDQKKAKIIPFESKQKGNETSENSATSLAEKVAQEIKDGNFDLQNVKLGTDTQKVSSDSIKNSSSQKSDLTPEAAQQENVPNNLLDLGDFIIREKAKLKRSQKKLKEQEILELYQKNLNIDIEQERANKDDLSLNGTGGILINKKQL